MSKELREIGNPVLRAEAWNLKNETRTVKVTELKAAYFEGALDATYRFHVALEEKGFTEEEIGRMIYGAPSES